MINKPIKRVEALQPLSREHHHGLLLCWKIRTGFALGVKPERMKKYINWFFDNYLENHFAIEEKYIFPILGDDNDLIIKAIAQHRELEGLFSKKDELRESLLLIEKNLHQHIRFEERVIFNKIQNIASDSQLKAFQEHHEEEKFFEYTTDVFWK